MTLWLHAVIHSLKSPWIKSKTYDTSRRNNLAKQRANHLSYQHRSSSRKQSKPYTSNTSRDRNNTGWNPNHIGYHGVVEDKLSRELKKQYEEALVTAAKGSLCVGAILLALLIIFKVMSVLCNKPQLFRGLLQVFLLT